MWATITVISLVLHVKPQSSFKTFTLDVIFSAPPAAGDRMLKKPGGKSHYF